MNVIEDTLPVDLNDFLHRPLFCDLASATQDGPRLSPLWFLWEDEFIWIVADTETKTYPRRVERDPRTAVSIVDFRPRSGRFQHVGMRGQASIEPFDVNRANRLLAKYLGPRRTYWDANRFTGPWDERWRFIRFDPDTVVARDHSYDPPPHY